MKQNINMPWEKTPALASFIIVPNISFIQLHTPRRPLLPNESLSFTFFSFVVSANQMKKQAHNRRRPMISRYSDQSVEKKRCLFRLPNQGK
jgi:hypothetical protein